MTTKAPERICFVNCGLPAEDCACYRSMMNAATVPADLHAAVVAERDELRLHVAKLLAHTDSLGVKHPQQTAERGAARAALAKQEPKE